MNETPPQPREVDPRDLTPEQLIHSLLEMQAAAMQLTQEKEDLQVVLAQQAAAMQRLSDANALNLGRLNNISAYLVDVDSLVDQVLRSYAGFAEKAGQDYGQVIDKIRPVIQLAAATIGHHLLRIIVGVEGDLTIGS